MTQIPHNNEGLLSKMTTGNMNPSEVTEQDFADMINSLYKNTPPWQPMQINAGFLLSCSDELFAGFWNNPNIECYGSIEAHNEIVDRAEKLGLTNIPKKL